MNIIDRFSTHLKEVLTQSTVMAFEMQNPQIEAVHLLYSLLGSTGSIAYEMLFRFKIEPKKIVKYLDKLPVDKKIDKKKGEQAVLAPFSNTARLIVEQAIHVSYQHQHSFVGTEHLLYAIINSKDLDIKEILKTCKVDISEIKKNLETVFGNVNQFPNLNETSEMIERLQEGLAGNSDAPAGGMFNPLMQGKRNMKEKSMLDVFAVHLTDDKIQKNIDPVIGRDKEIDRIVQIICRRTKNNPILLGDPGVGKTAIIEGLAKRILHGQVPDILLDKKIYTINLTSVLAGTTFRGDFESRLQQLVDEITTKPEIIVFIDEIHNLVGAGSNQGTMDAANILKPALARGQIRCIGATTPNEFKKYIESDSALERRFQPVYVKQSSVQDTTKILIGIKENFEKYHNVTISDQACSYASKLADRYITDKYLPDKAIDLLDETASAKKIGFKHSADQLQLIELKKHLEKIGEQKEEAVNQEKFDLATKLKMSEEIITESIGKIESKMISKKKAGGKVTEKDVVNQLAKMLNTDVDELLWEERDKLNELDKKIKTHIVGQDNAISEVSHIIRQAQLQLSNPDRPMASFMFVGSSGVGKTELAKVIADVLYPNQDALIKLDMSEFNESFSVSKLIGSPAGYVGYKDKNVFTDKLKINPYSVILLDEIDKAHKDVTKLLLQILENGEITDSTGRKISLKHGIIVLTTSVGSKNMNGGNIGFDNDVKTSKNIFNTVVEELKDHFGTDLINRLDKVCLLNNLTKEDLVKITKIEVEKLNQRLKKYKTKLVINKSIKIEQLIPNKSIDARVVKNHLRKELEKMIAQKILGKKIKESYEISIKNKQIHIE